MGAILYHDRASPHQVTPPPIRTPRLILMPSTLALLHLEMDDSAGFATAIQAVVPKDWPPGEYDRDAMEFFLQKMAEGGDAVIGWYGWYAIRRGSESELASLVGGGGYMGPPDESGCVEVGYSVSEQWRGQGIAAEMVTALMKNAFDNGAARIIAHTRADNPASIAVLKGCGFECTSSADPSVLEFECTTT
jgi:RimJ/RimL family protein N-acetyltransferase